MIFSIILSTYLVSIITTFTCYIMSVTIENLLLHERSGRLVTLTEQDFKGDTNLKTRTILLDWVYQVSKMLKLNSEVFFQTVSMIDVCLKHTYVTTKDLQLLGVTCLLISSKKYDIYPPEIGDFVFLCEGSIKRSEVIDKEMEIMQLMNFDVEFPNVMEYIKCVSGESIVDADVGFLTKILCSYYYCCNTSSVVPVPSVIATACFHMVTSFKGQLLKNPFGIPLLTIALACESIANAFLKRTTLTSNMNEVFEKAKSVVGDAFEGVKFVEHVNKFLIGTSAIFFVREYTVNFFSNFTPKLKHPNKSDYQKIKRLGGGSYGDVYKVKLKKDVNGTEYALKLSDMGDEGISQSFIREVSILQNVEHKNVVKIFEVLSNAKGFVLELMDSDLKFFSVSNEALIKSSFTLQEKIAKDLLSGLEYIHSNGILNRDIKPQNVLVRGNWNPTSPDDLEIKLCDFGLSRGKGLLPLEACHTTEVCTLWYRPPELLLGKVAYDCKVDVWSMACTIYEVCASKVLFPGDCEIDQLHRIFRTLGTPNKEVWDGIESLPNYNKNWPKWVKQDGLGGYHFSKKVTEVIEKSLIMNPEKRPMVSEILREFKTYEKQKVEHLDMDLDINVQMVNLSISEKKKSATHKIKSILNYR